MSFNIESKAMLVKMSITQWSNQATDKKIATEIAEKYDVSTREDRYIKTLLPRAAVKGIAQAITRLRAFHTHNTLPWQDDSVRILASTNFFQYQQGVMELRAELDTEIGKFLSAYPTMMWEAQQAKKALFNAKQYPTVKELESMYSVNVRFLPFPSVTDFRVDIGEEQMASIRAETARELEAAISTATRSLSERILERISLLHSALAVPEKTFRDATVSSVLETADIVERLNVIQDTGVQQLIDATRTVMQHVTAEQLRALPTYREEVARKLQSLQSLQSLQPPGDTQ